MKDFLDRSTTTQRAYANIMWLQGRLLEARGQRFEATSRFMRGWRSVGGDSGDSAVARAAQRMIRNSCYRGSELVPIAENSLHAEFVSSTEAQSIRVEYAAFPPMERVRMRYPRKNDDPQRQGDLVILKEYDPDTGERGAILISFTESIRRFAALFDLPAIAKKYALILEPSWWGYQDATFLLYLGADLDVLIESPAPADYDFISSLKSNIWPTRVGAGDWIDPQTFRPNASPSRSFDVVMVSSWNPVKRHEDLFRALDVLQRKHGRQLRTALVGFSNGWTRGHIEKLARKHHVLDLLTFFESVPHSAVSEVVADSAAYVLLSRREGANRALYEAMLCDTPVIVYEKHRGVNLHHITPEVGATFPDGRLAEAILSVLDTKGFAPREWALRHTGYHNATRIINEQLADMASARGRPWRRELVEKKMAPALYYADAESPVRFESEYLELLKMMRPIDGGR